MQEGNRTFSEFLKLTDQLAHQLGRNVSELPEKLGISKSMLYAYRAGQNPITAKAWAKLDDALREVPSKIAEKSDFVRSHGKPYKVETDLREKVLGKVCEDDVPYHFIPKLQPEQPGESLLPVLERIANALEILVEQGKKKK